MNQLIRRAIVIAAAVAAAPALSPDLAAQEQEVEQIGEVYYSPEKDAMTDADIGFVFAHARSDDDFREASLQWHCMEDGLAVAYDWGRFFPGNGQGGIDVQFRFEGAEAEAPAVWTLLRTYRAAFMPAEAVVSFTEQALHVPAVTVRATSGDRAMTDRFPLGGLEQALERLPCINFTGSAPAAQP